MPGDELKKIYNKELKIYLSCNQIIRVDACFNDKISKGLQIQAGRQAQYNRLEAGVLDEPYSQLTPLSGVAVQARQST
jgi:hypothetical protein